MTGSEGEKDVVYIRDILQDFDHSQVDCTELYEDNHTVITISTNPVISICLLTLDI
jgi:hypothetical protein